MNRTLDSIPELLTLWATWRGACEDVKRLHTDNTDITDAQARMHAAYTTLFAVPADELLAAAQSHAGLVTALAEAQQTSSLYRLDNDGHHEYLSALHQELLRELPDSETTAALGRMLNRWKQAPGEPQYVLASELEPINEALNRFGVQFEHQTARHVALGQALVKCVALAQAAKDPASRLDPAAQLQAIEDVARTALMVNMDKIRAHVLAETNGAP